MSSVRWTAFPTNQTSNEDHAYAYNNSQNATALTANYKFLNTSMVMFLSGVSGNLIALIILFGTRVRDQSKTVFQFLIKALVLNDVTFIIMTSIPPQLAYAYDMKWQGGAAACHYHASAMLCAGLTTPFLITIMSIERVLCLSWWRFYVQNMTKRRVLQIVLASTAFAATYSILPVMGIGKTSLQARGSWCYLDLRSKHPIDRVYSFIYASFLTLAIIVSLAANLYVIVILLRYRTMRKHIMRQCYVAAMNECRFAIAPTCRPALRISDDTSHSLRNTTCNLPPLTSTSQANHYPFVLSTTYRPPMAIPITISEKCKKHSKTLLRNHYENTVIAVRQQDMTSAQQQFTAARRASLVASLSGHRLKDVELQMVVLLFVLTIVFTVCWTPLTAHIFLSLLGISTDKFFLTILMASINQIIDPWCYVVLRIGALVQVFGVFKRYLRNCMRLRPLELGGQTDGNHGHRLFCPINDRNMSKTENACDCMCDCPCHMRSPHST